MSHNFLPSIKKGVKYCSYCGCLSYNNIPSKDTICQFKNQYFIGFDPLQVKYKPISLNIDFSSLSHKNYINNRKKGLLKIYFLSNKFNLSEMIKYKAIGAIDQIYLNNKDIPIEYIETIASICILLAIEFNDCCSNSKVNKSNSQNCYPLNNNSNVNNQNVDINNLKSLYQYIKNEIKNIMYWQTYCLKKLDYNLGKYSAYDYLNLFFDLGIVFSNEKNNFLNISESCFNLLEQIITTSNICKYSHYLIAMSLIYIQFINTDYFDKNAFKYIYGVDFSKKKYKMCINELSMIIKNSFNEQPCINEDISKHLIYTNKYEDNFNYKNNNFFDRNIYIVNNNPIVNSNNSILRELSLQYTYFYEQIHHGNYLNIYNDINNIYYKFSFLSLSGHNDKLAPNFTSSNFGLNIENFERKISFKNKEFILK
jgi:hypothetical protein